MTLPAASARARAADSDRQPVRGASSYRSIYAARAGAQQQSSSTSLLLSIDGTDRRTDTHRYIDPASHTNIIILMIYSHQEMHAKLTNMSMSSADNKGQLRTRSLTNNNSSRNNTEALMLCGDM